jgi:hypothetical protein
MSLFNIQSLALVHFRGKEEQSEYQDKEHTIII